MTQHHVIIVLIATWENFMTDEAVPILSETLVIAPILLRGIVMPVPVIASMKLIHAIKLGDASVRSIHSKP